MSELGKGENEGPGPLLSADLVALLRELAEQDDTSLTDEMKQAIRDLP